MCVRVYVCSHVFVCHSHVVYNYVDYCMLLVVDIPTYQHVCEHTHDIIYLYCQ